MGALALAVASAEKIRLANVDAESCHSFVENAVEGISRTTRDSKYLFTNEELARTYGYETREQLMN